MRYPCTEECSIVRAPAVSEIWCVRCFLRLKIADAGVSTSLWVSQTHEPAARPCPSRPGLDHRSILFFRRSSSVVKSRSVRRHAPTSRTRPVVHCTRPSCRSAGLDLVHPAILPHLHLLSRQRKYGFYDQTTIITALEGRFLVPNTVLGLSCEHKRRPRRPPPALHSVRHTRFRPFLRYTHTMHFSALLVAVAGCVSVTSVVADHVTGGYHEPPALADRFLTKRKTTTKSGDCPSTP